MILAGATATLDSSQAISSLKIGDLKSVDLLSASARFDCHARIWDWIKLSPPEALLKRSVGKRVGYLQKDDELIRRDGGWKGLGDKEVERACIERGIDVLGKEDKVLRQELGTWFGEKK